MEYAAKKYIGIPYKAMITPGEIINPEYLEAIGEARLAELIEEGSVIALGADGRPASPVEKPVDKTPEPVDKPKAAEKATETVPAKARKSTKKAAPRRAPDPEEDDADEEVIEPVEGGRMSLDIGETVIDAPAKAKKKR